MVACMFDANVMPVHVKAWQTIAMSQVGDAKFFKQAPQTPGQLSPVLGL